MSESVTLILGCLVGIVILLTLITIHEFGHFIVAKLAGAYVYEFSVGFGPRIFVIKGKETWFSFRLFPLGGYCSIASDKVEPPAGRDDTEIPDERKLDYIKRWKKLLFLVFGPLMNLFVALTIFTLTFAITQAKTGDATWVGAKYGTDKVAWKLLNEAGAAKITDDQVYVIWGWRLANNEEVIFDNVSEMNELSKNYQINESTALIATSYLATATTFNASIAAIDADLKTQPETQTDDITLAFAYKLVNKFSGNAVDKEVEWTRASTTSEYKLKDLIGLAAPTRYFKNSTIAYGYGWKETFTQSISGLKAFGMIFTGKFSSLSGPLGIAGQTASMFGDANKFMLYVGMMSANLFIFNMIIIPPLDGYKLIEVIIEMIIKKELPQKYKYTVYALGAIFVAALVVVVTVFDVMR